MKNKLQRTVLGVILPFTWPNKGNVKCHNKTTTTRKQATNKAIAPRTCWQLGCSWIYIPNLTSLIILIKIISLVSFSNQ